jgi:hypothetical protein
MRILLALLILGVGAWMSSSAHADESMEAVCQSIERPNIDCQCVARRIEVFQRFAPTDAAKRMIAERYRFELGLPNDFETAAIEAYGEDEKESFMRRMALQESLDQVGGEPSSINDLEEGCVIAGASPITIAPPRSINMGSEYSSQAYIESCVRAIGESGMNQRFCQCTAERLTSRLTDAEFEAYFRSFAQYDDASTQEALSRVRARAMGISVSQYDRLAKTARTTVETNKQADERYCQSRIWADEDPGQTEDQRKLAGFEPGIALMTAPAPITSEDLMSGEPVDRARKIMRKNCADGGNSETYCRCYMTEFETRVVDRAPNGNTALSWALLQGNAAMTNMDYMATMQSIPPADQQAAAMMLMDTNDLGEACPKMDAQDPVSTPLGKTPAERMMAICIEENDDEALCNCMVENMESKFPPDDFELIVDIREAEFRGAEDALATVAEDRGLNRAEAEAALMNNPAVMGGTMAMAGSLMQCMGGVPAMPTMPMILGMPQQ